MCFPPGLIPGRLQPPHLCQPSWSPPCLNACWGFVCLTQSALGHITLRVVTELLRVLCPQPASKGRLGPSLEFFMHCLGQQ